MQCAHMHATFTLHIPQNSIKEKSKINNNDEKIFHYQPLTIQIDAQTRLNSKHGHFQRTIFFLLQILGCVQYFFERGICVFVSKLLRVQELILCALLHSFNIFHSLFICFSFRCLLRRLYIVWVCSCTRIHIYVLLKKTKLSSHYTFAAD